MEERQKGSWAGEKGGSEELKVEEQVNGNGLLTRARAWFEVLRP